MAVLRTWMRPIVPDAEWPAVTVDLSFGLFATIVSPAKTAEPIEMLFGLWSRVGQRNDVSLRKMGNFEGGRGDPLSTTGILSAVSCTKTAEPIEMPYGVWTG